MNCQTQWEHVILMLSRWWQLSWKFEFSVMSRPICLWSLLFLTCVLFFRFSICNILVIAPVTLLCVDIIFFGLHNFNICHDVVGCHNQFFSFLLETSLLTCACIFHLFSIFVHIYSALFKTWFINSHLPIGAMSQDSFSILICNVFKHIVTFHPFTLNVLLWPSLRHRWSKFYRPLGAIFQNYLDALLLNCIIHIG